MPTCVAQGVELVSPPATTSSSKCSSAFTSRSSPPRVHTGWAPRLSANRLMISTSTPDGSPPESFTKGSSCERPTRISPLERIRSSAPFWSFGRRLHETPVEKMRAAVDIRRIANCISQNAPNAIRLWQHADAPEIRMAANKQRRSAAKFFADLYGTFDQVDVFEDLQPQVVIERPIFGQEFVDDIQRLFASLAADERTEPAVDEEYLAVAFVIGKLLKSFLQIRQCEVGMSNCVPRPEGRFDPAFADLFVVYKIIPVLRLVLGRRNARLGGVSIPLRIVAGFRSFEFGQQLRRIRVVQDQQPRDDVEAIFGFERQVRTRCVSGGPVW